MTPAQEIVQGWEGKTAGINQSIEGKPLTLNGTVYEHGLGLHANSEAIYDLDENYSRFTAVIGIDDEVGAYAEDGKDGATFRIYATVKNTAGKDTEILIYEKNVTDVTEPLYVDVSVEGATRLRLVTDQVSNNSKDHTDWADPVLWGVLRDVSAADDFAVYAAKSIDSETVRSYIRITAPSSENIYNIKLTFKDKSGEVLYEEEKTDLVQTDSSSVYVIEADTIPDGFAYAEVEITDGRGSVIGAGIL